MRPESKRSKLFLIIFAILTSIFLIIGIVYLVFNSIMSGRLNTPYISKVLSSEGIRPGSQWKEDCPEFAKKKVKIKGATSCRGRNYQLNIYYYGKDNVIHAIKLIRGYLYSEDCQSDSGRIQELVRPSLEKYQHDFSHHCVKPMLPVSALTMAFLGVKPYELTLKIEDPKYKEPYSDWVTSRTRKKKRKKKSSSPRALSH